MNEVFINTQKRKEKGKQIEVKLSSDNKSSTLSRFKKLGLIEAQGKINLINLCLILDHSNHDHIQYYYIFYSTYCHFRSATIFSKKYHTPIIKVSLNFQQKHKTIQLNFSSKFFMHQIVTFFSLSRPQAKFTTHEKPTLNC